MTSERAPEIGGHVRIGNRLYEAIVSTPFTEVQLRLVLAILRQTVGWQRRTVNASHAELAQLIGLRKVSGGFRTALRELTREGVLVVTDAGGGSESNAYSLQHDFEQWGRFSQSAAKLESIWGGRPDHSDQLNLTILTVSKGAHPDSPESGSPTDTLTPQSQGPRLPRVIPPDSTESGSRHPTPAIASSSGAGKTVKDSERQLPPATARRGRGDAMQLLTAIEALKERSTMGEQREFIRRERIRTELGIDVEEALKLCGGVERLLRGKPEYRGALIAQFADALNHVRHQEASA